MKVLKPLRMSLLHRTFEVAGEVHFVATPLLFIPTGDRRALVSEIELWKTIGEELGPNVPFDAGMPKTEGEWLVTGRAFSHGGVPRPVVQVSAEVAGAKKKLAVFGDRNWGLVGRSEPAPFLEMPVDWAHAFGGKGFAENPLGKGFAPVETDAGLLHALPNIEHPKHLIGSPGDRPAPSGFDAMDSSWPQRAKNLGTYDKKWLETDYPGLPRDLHWSFFNAAPLDQRRAGFFNGDEMYSFENMHSTMVNVSGQLPRVVTRCFITQRTADGTVFRELKPRLETLHFFPHLERVLLVYRATTIIREDDAADITHILIACEDADEPRPIAHYEAVQAERVDKSKGGVALLRDSDLVPGWAAGKLSDFAGPELAACTPDQLLQQNLSRRHERQIAATRAYVASLGLDPDEHGPKIEPDPVLPTLDELSDFAENMREEVGRREAETRAKLAESDVLARKLFEENGLDFSVVEKERETMVGGPPPNRTKIEREFLEKVCADCRAAGYVNDEIETLLADADVWEQKAKIDEMARSSYRVAAHQMPAATAIDDDAKRAIRVAVQSAYAKGESFVRWDLTGADLSGLNLSDANFEEAFLECVDFSGATLSGVNFTGAVLARANLSGAQLEGATLVEANLGAADLRGIHAKGANLTGAILAGANLDAARFVNATLDRVDFSDAVIGKADFTGVTVSRAFFMKTDLAGATFTRATLREVLFFEVSVEGVNFSEACLEKSVFLRSRGTRALFHDADLENLRFVETCDFRDASFARSKMGKANLRGALLAGADFSGANLDGADLSEADLVGAKLPRANLSNAMLIRTRLDNAVMTGANLMNAILQKAELGGADLRHANLYEADMARVLRTDGTQMGGANLTRTRVLPRRQS